MKSNLAVSFGLLFKECKRQAQREKCHSNLAFVPSHPIPFRIASLSHEILLLSVKLQKGEQQLNGVWGRKHQLYGDPIQGSQSKLRHLSVLSIAAKWHQSSLCTCLRRHKQCSKKRKERKVSGQYHSPRLCLGTIQVIPLTGIPHTKDSNCFDSFSTTPITYTFC